MLSFGCLIRFQDETRRSSNKVIRSVMLHKWKYLTYNMDLDNYKLDFDYQKMKQFRSASSHNKLFHIFSVIVDRIIDEYATQIK